MSNAPDTPLDRRTETPAHIDIPPPPPEQLAALLDRYAPFTPAPLCPEVSAFHARSLVEIWEAAEKLAGHILPAPFWAYPWAGGCSLARIILDNAEWVRGARVLDLGAGGGVTALASAYAGAAEVTANDVDAWALATAELAAQRQGLRLRLLHADLTAAAAASDSGSPWDVVLCSELAYDRGTAPLQRAFLEAARRAGARVFLADAGRTYFDAGGLNELGWFNLPVPEDLEGVDKRVATVYEMR